MIKKLVYKNLHTLKNKNIHNANYLIHAMNYLIFRF